MNANHWLKHPEQRHQCSPTGEPGSAVPGRQRSLCWACPGQSSFVVCDSSASDPAAQYSRVHWCPPPGPHPPHPNGFWTGGWSSKCLKVIQWQWSNRSEEMKKANFKKGEEPPSSPWKANTGQTTWHSRTGERSSHLPALPHKYILRMSILSAWSSSSLELWWNLRSCHPRLLWTAPASNILPSWKPFISSCSYLKTPPGAAP